MLTVRCACLPGTICAAAISARMRSATSAAASASLSSRMTANSSPP